MSKTRLPRGNAGAEWSTGWIEAARNGDGAALGRAMEAERPYLRRYARTILPVELQGNLGASDLVQQTFLNAKRHFSKFRGRTRGEWREWLRVTLGRVLAARERRLSHRLDAGDLLDSGRPHPVDPGPSPSQDAIRKEGLRDLLHALTQLTDEYRQVILLHHVHKLSFEEIAVRLGKSSADAVRKIHSRAILKLKAILGSGDDSR
jgi:RNA polymerase sigma-70 factor (ECF subfamily)